MGLAFVIGFCYLNYGTDFILNLKNKYAWTNQIISFHMLMYGSPFLLGYAIQSVHRKSFAIFKRTDFLLLALFAVVVFSLRSSAHILVLDLYHKIANKPHALWYYALILTTAKSMLIFIPIGIYWWFKDKKNMPFYGFSRKNFDLKPYFVMLGLMLPLIVLASTQSDFLGSYPRGARFQDLSVDNSSDSIYYAIYELFYGLDFFGIEFFFRGFLVMAFVYLVGPRAILPMAMFYVVIHYGKPMGELISSFFGGTLLGIIAYYSRSIWGGIIVHVGIAYLMELGAFIGNLSKT